MFIFAVRTTLHERIRQAARRLSLTDAIFIGLGSMLGTGVFAAIAPAAGAASAGMLIGLLIAGLVALFNAMSSAQLARLYPVSGGTYVYSDKRLGEAWGWMSGWAFIVGKLASCAAAALTFGNYIFPGQAEWFAALAVVTLTLLNHLGVEKTAAAVKALVLIVVLSLIAVCIMALSGAPGPEGTISFSGPDSIYGVLQSAGIWFLAFAGYARIATLGEEVKAPERNIPRAMFLSLGMVLLIYAAVSISALSAVGAEALSLSDRPLAFTISEAGFGRWSWFVTLGASMATLGVMLSLMAGIDRTRSPGRRPPDALLHGGYPVPRSSSPVSRWGNLDHNAHCRRRSAIGFSAFPCFYYPSPTSRPSLSSERMLGRWSAFAGLLGCLVLSFTLPPGAVIAGGLVLVAGLVSGSAAPGPIG